MRCGVPHYCNLRTNLIKLTNNKHFLAETEYSIMNVSKKKKNLSSGLLTSVAALHLLFRNSGSVGDFTAPALLSLSGVPAASFSSLPERLVRTRDGVAGCTLGEEGKLKVPSEIKWWLAVVTPPTFQGPQPPFFCTTAVLPS